MSKKQKVAVIFAATGEIAGAVSRSLSEKGIKTYLTGKNLKRLKILSNRINKNGGNSYILKANALRENDIENTFRKIIRENGCFDIVFNGIGLKPDKTQYGIPSLKLSLNNFIKTITVIAGSQFLTSKAAAKFMRRTGKGGTILTLSSGLTRSRVPFMAGITAASAGVEGMTLSLKDELKKYGINIICINSAGIRETETIRKTTKAIFTTCGIIPDKAIENGRNPGLTLIKAAEKISEIALFPEKYCKLNIVNIG